MMDTSTKPNTCMCIHHKIIPMIILLFGVTFLFRAVGILGYEAVSIAWPTYVIAVGIMKLIGEDKCGCC